MKILRWPIKMSEYTLTKIISVIKSVKSKIEKKILTEVIKLKKYLHMYNVNVFS